jgi:hypothetical protein
MERIGIKSTKKTEETGSTISQRRLLHQAQTAVPESRLVLRLRRRSIGEREKIQMFDNM